MDRARRACEDLLQRTRARLVAVFDAKGRKVCSAGSANASDLIWLESYVADLVHASGALGKSLRERNFPKPTSGEQLSGRIQVTFSAAADGGVAVLFDDATTRGLIHLRLREVITDLMPPSAADVDEED